MGSGIMTPEDLLQSWERALHVSNLVGVNNAMVVDSNGFVLFVKVSVPPPQKVHIPIRRPSQAGGPYATNDPGISYLEANLKSVNYNGWVVYG